MVIGEIKQGENREIRQGGVPAKRTQERHVHMETLRKINRKAKNRLYSVWLIKKIPPLTTLSLLPPPLFCTTFNHYFCIPPAH